MCESLRVEPVLGRLTKGSDQRVSERAVPIAV